MCALITGEKNGSRDRYLPGYPPLPGTLGWGTRVPGYLGTLGPQKQWFTTVWVQDTILLDALLLLITHLTDWLTPK